jgi:hypothetical protein
MENLVLSKIDSTTATPRNIVLDKYPTTDFEPALFADYYWRYEDEPTSEFNYAGQAKVEAPFNFPIEGSGREVRISMIGISEDGVASATDPREGVQTTILLPSPIDNIVIYDGEIVFYDGEIVTYG